MYLTLHVESVSINCSMETGLINAHQIFSHLRLFQMVRRQRVDFMSGQHQLAHFFKGKDTPTTDVLQVGYYT